MNPILEELDLLEIVPYSDRPVRVGDVILCLPPEGGKPVVHRVVRVTQEGIRTRGDNSTTDDPWLLQPTHITGRVVAAWCGQKRRKIAGGRAGWVLAHLTGWGRAFDQSVSSLLRPIYRSIARCGIVRHVLPTRLRPRVAVFQANGRSYLQLLLGRRVVGRYDARQRQWHIQRPFRLFVDEPALPRTGEIETTCSELVMGQRDPESITPGEKTPVGLAFVDCSVTSPVSDKADPTDNALNWILARLALRWRSSPSMVLSKNPADGFLEVVKDLALANRVTGPLYWQALSHPPLFPEQLARWLGFAHSVALLRFGHWRDEVCQLLEALTKAGVSVVILKGWALIASLYEGDAGQRLAMDLDLLVPTAEVGRALTVLTRLNYAMLTSDPWPGFSQRYRNGLIYRRPCVRKTAFHVGLHWELLDVPYHERIPIEDWFARAEPARIARVEALVPAPEDHLVYLCGHLALHHRYDPALFRYHDMAALIHHEGDALDWDAVVERAVDWRLVIPLQRTLARLEKLWPEMVLAGVAQDVAGLQPTRAERWIHRWVVGRSRNPTSHMLLSLATMPGLTRRVRFLLEQAFPSPAYMRRRYCPQPPGLWPLAYLQRAGLGLQYLLQRLR